MRRRFAILALAIGLAACDNTNNSVEPSGSVAGTYTLRTVNGGGLPFTFSDGSTLTSDVLTLFSDGTYSDAAQYSDGGVSVETGFWDSQNGSINFTIGRTGQTYQASLSGTVLTEIFTSVTEVFQRN